VNYDVTSFDGGAPGGADRPDEKAVFTRQLQFKRISSGEL
jgi:hypothetical protein